MRKARKNETGEKPKKQNKTGAGSVIDGRLVREGMRRLRPAGITGLVLTMVSLLCLLLANSRQLASDYYDWRFNYRNAFVKSILQGKAAGAVSEVVLDWLNMRMLYIVLVPVMLLIVFGHVNKRAEADLYDALPVRKRTLFCSRALAVLLWAGLLIFVYTAFETVINCGGIANALRLSSGNTPSAERISMTYKNCLLTELYQMLKAAAGCLLAVGGFAVGMAATGTRLTGLIASLTLLLMPSVLAQSILSNVQQVEFLDFTHGPLQYIDKVYNVYAEAFVGTENLLYGYGSMGGYSMTDNFSGLAFTVSASDAAAVVYSLALGAVYIALGCALYVRRRSEIAERPSLNPVWRNVLGLLPALLLSLIGVYQIVGVLMYAQVASASFPYRYLLWLAAGALFYLLYGLFTTKSAKQTAKSLIWFPIVPVVAGIVGAASYGAVEAAVSRIPDAEEIVSVRIEGYGNYAPFSEALGEIELTSDAVREQLAACLKETVNEWKDNGCAYRDYGGFVDGRADFRYDVNVRFETDSGGFWRRMLLNDGQAEAIGCALAEEEAVRAMKVGLYDLTSVFELAGEEASGESEQNAAANLYSRLGAGEKVLYCGRIGSALTQKQLLQVYDTYREEVMTLDDQYRIFLGQDLNREGVFDFLQDDWHDIDFPVSVDTPKTAALICNLENKRLTDIYDLDSYIALAKSCDLPARIKETDAYQESGSIEGIYGSFDEEQVGLSWIYYDCSEKKLYAGSADFATDGTYYGTMGIRSDQLDELYAILKPHTYEEITMDQDAILLTWSGEKCSTAERWYNLTDEEGARICALLPMKEYIRSNQTQYNYDTGYITVD